MVVLNALAENVINGNEKEVENLVKEALDGNVPVNEIHEGLIKGMNVVGEKYKRNEFYIPELLIAGRAMKKGMSLIRPLLTESCIEPIGKVAIGVVEGILHERGKNLVAMMLECAGFEVIDLGGDVPPERFIEVIIKERPQIVAMSVLVSVKMEAMKNTIDAIKKAGVREKVKIMVGGAPVTKEYAEEIGADGYAPDAASAVAIAKELMGL